MTGAEHSVRALGVPLESYIVLVLYRYLELNPTDVVVHFVQCKATTNVLSVRRLKNVSAICSTTEN